MARSVQEAIQNGQRIITPRSEGEVHVPILPQFIHSETSNGVTRTVHDQEASRAHREALRANEIASQ